MTRTKGKSEKRRGKGGGVTDPTAFQFLSLLEQVHAAMPAARELLLEGISTYERRDDDTMTRIQEVAADADLNQLLEELTEDKRAVVGNGMLAGLAVGIAVGLMLSGPFLPGGAK